MKINEKNLCMFAVTPPVDREGWLLKRGEVNKSWQRRYFVLKGNLLFYFEKKGEREPLGVIILEGCTIELAEDGEQYCFQIVFHGINNRTYFLSAESQGLMEMWMKALTCAGYEYMKLMVAELQRQLNEIEEAKAIDPTVTPKPPPRRQNPFNRPIDNRPAPPPPNYPAISNSPTIATNSISSESQAANFNGGGNGTVSSATINSPSNARNNLVTPMLSPANTVNELSFGLVHEAFGKEIQRNLGERKRIKELAERPLIDL